MAKYEKVGNIGVYKKKKESGCLPALGCLGIIVVVLFIIGAMSGK